MKTAKKNVKSLEVQLIEINERAAANSGMLNFPAINSQRKAILSQIEKTRPLSQIESINLYGYKG